MSDQIQTARRSAEGTLLEVDDLRTHFRTERGLVRAVDGVTLSLERGRSLGIVGESGSGKTVLSRTIMGLLPSNAVLHGSVDVYKRQAMHRPYTEADDESATMAPHDTELPEGML